MIWSLQEIVSCDRRYPIKIIGDKVNLRVFTIQKGHFPTNNCFAMFQFRSCSGKYRQHLQYRLVKILKISVIGCNLAIKRFRCFMAFPLSMFTLSRDGWSWPFFILYLSP